MAAGRLKQFLRGPVGLSAVRLTKWGYRASALAARRLTAGSRALPDVYVLGATKCGTSSLYRYLSRHPRFVPAYLKELQYLHELEGFRSNYERSAVARAVWGHWRRGGEAGYRKFFPRRSALAAGADGTPALTGEATPFYLYSAACAERVADLTPDARFIILLRNPVDRTFSDYHMQIRRDRREDRPLEQALDDELAGRCPHFRLRYLHQSVYEPHVRAWMERFPREQFLVLRSEDFFSRTGDLMQQTFAFLGLEAFDPGDYPVVNQGSYRKKLGGRVRQRLIDYFRPHNQRLYESLDRDFQWDV